MIYKIPFNNTTTGIILNYSDSYLDKIINKEFFNTKKLSKILWIINIKKGIEFGHTINYSNRKAIFYYKKSKLFPAEKAIASFISRLILFDNYLVLHASAVVKNGQVYIFCGKQGSGKTTISSMMNCSKLSDDAAFLTIDKKSIRITLSPFEKSAVDLEQKYYHYPIKCIYLIKKSLKCNITEITEFESLQKLSQNTFSDFYNIQDTKYSVKKYYILMNMIRYIKVYNLSYNLDRNFLNSL